MISEEENYLRPKESIRTKDSQLGDVEKDINRTQQKNWDQ